MERNFAVTVTRSESNWQVRRFSEDSTNIETAIKAVRGLRAESAAFALLCVDDEYFVIVRPTPSRVRLFLSDASMAAVDDFAASLLEEMDIDIPDIPEEDFADTEGWPDGDFDILADLGISEQVLSILCDESEWWASEQLQSLCEELGCEEEFSRAVGMDISE
ncbi:tRNA adenosine deaminase-associated protein [Corynebacterium sp. ES2794-CONJ1]|uniref:tRNA adenosine deaminase-associated protein n=1 Tax=unclassified Corynebacterium TaxID=2624378 RepID=UPI002169775E|nr:MULTISPECIES: tRNA adenosine deaminase-associated protein [unclassified Corynebacterium]MCS4490367.1 tRNA adenosine deaminase-associated protein [Corynebacterium sp. ES2775-CONJ]MCS4492145.1 tRNA adenosine deaminase-associated protein [Corynebacterium sp. ES2715-CONJ3]MCS4532371.1 tRNA adenosine deaminase-associated protein [Corynebacterium sp. ES2730-CONJ]MCU9519666.1 tRNA adenosine deaminase-associated protein [Corynebacterium sp. ES2794-CONJ1]